MTRTALLNSLRQDLVYGLRQLRKSPSFTTVAALSLALGIGATSAIFSVVDTVLLRPLPYGNADRVLRVSQRNGGGEMWSIPVGNFVAWRREASASVDLTAVWGPIRATLTAAGAPASITDYVVSSNYFDVLRIAPIAGRYFSADEDRPGAPRVAVISEALWRNRFGAASDIIGRQIILNDRPYSVVGVSPSSYLLRPPGEAVWTPFVPTADQLNDFGDHELTVYALPRAGVTAATVARQISSIDTPLARQHPHALYDGGVIVRPLPDVLLGDFRLPLYLLMGAVVVVLLIACANIANLLLARATVRRTEIAVRLALGAARRRIVAQLLVESVLLGTLGGAVGMAVAFVGVRFLVSSPLLVPRLHDATLDWRVIAFAAALSLCCAIAFGLAPALRAAGVDLQQTLRAGGRESRAPGHQALRRVLVVAQLCLSQVLLVGAGLLIRSAANLRAVPIGFEVHDITLFNVLLPSARYGDSVRVESALEQIQGGLAAIPGVRSAAWAQTAPIYGDGWNWTAMREGSDGHDAGAFVSDMRSVSPDYFSTLQLPVARGRAFTRSDGQNAPRVAIVSRGLADKLWPGQDPVGKRVSNGGNVWREVVGVANDMHSEGPRDQPPLVMYMPAAQFANNGVTFMVRSALAVSSLAASIRRVVAGVDPNLAISGMSTMEQALGNLSSLDSFVRWLLTLLGATGLVLALVGVYGVIAYFVAQRHHELGVRLALGASGRSLEWLVVRQGLVLAVVGVAVGLPVALLATRLLSVFVFGITPHDPATFAVVATVLVAIAAAAAYVPARRTTRMDPLEALRSG